MSDTYSFKPFSFSAPYGHTPTAERCRAEAVEIALELIRARMLAGEEVTLETHLQKLSDYADAIQKALKANQS